MYKILLVDDEILVREAISAKIEWNKLGFELIGDCENGKEAIGFIKENQIDVVLTDIYMPYVDGLELSKYIYEEQPDINVIIFSGYNDFEYAHQALKYRVSEYILKPVTAKELSEVLLKMKEQLDKQNQEKEKLDKLTRAYQTYTKNESHIVSGILSNLAKGTQEVKTLLPELEGLGVRIGGKSYRVVLVDVDVNIYDQDAVEEFKKDSAVILFALNNIAEEMMEKSNAGLSFVDNDNRICLLFYTNKVKEYNLEVHRICREFQETVHHAKKDLYLSVGIGIYVDSLMDLSRSYDSAGDALAHQYSKGGGIILDSEDALHKGDLNELKEIYQEVAVSLHKNEKDEVVQTLEKLKQWLKAGNLTSIEVVSYLHQVQRIIVETVQERNESFEMQEKDFDAISAAKNLNEAMQIIMSFALKALDSAASVMQSAKEKQSLLAVEYLNLNYANSDLTLNDICDYLGISTSHFSNLFKEETGKTFLEYLNGIRMEKAKQLLRETSLKNYEIAEKVGFDDPHYFSIVFKKATGMTPKKYAGITHGE